MVIPGAKRCPWCREPIKNEEITVCPACDGALESHDGRELRAIDLRYQEVEAEQKRRLRDMLIYGSVAVAIITFVMPALHIGAALLIPVMMAAHLLTLNIYLIRKSRLLLGRTRRFFLRWIARFVFLWIALPGYGLGTVPLFGVAAGVVTFAGLTLGISTYTLWSLEREYRRAPLAIWEKLILALLAAATLLAVAFLVAATLILGWSAAWLLDSI